MAGTRRDIAKLGGPWSGTMLWYARAVGALRGRTFSNRTSWTYLAAIHGFNEVGWLSQGVISPANPLPAQAERDIMFDQCQHAGWFFLPWHRGYVAAFERVLEEWIVENGGPSDWALPYWNYLNAADSNARDIPQEFTDLTLPGTTDPNPLADAVRGPASSLGPLPWIGIDISLAEQTGETVYTSVPGTLGYGGPISGFTQQGNAFGGLESNPHNFVHVMIGGDTSLNPAGWMFDPNFAALDPIFWVHHCNIDRLWAAWMTDPGNSQETSQPWRNGPFPRQFLMPEPDQNVAVFVPDDTLPGAHLAPTYDDLVDGTGIVAPIGGAVVASPSGPSGPSSLVGANTSTVTVGASSVTSAVLFSQDAVASLMSPGSRRYYLNIEGVRGQQASAVLTARVSAPGLEEPAFTETFVFFGLANASAGDGPHAGNGLSSTADITKKVGDLLDELDAASPQLDVKLFQGVGQEIPELPLITVDRISIYQRE